MSLDLGCSGIHFAVDVATECISNLCLLPSAGFQILHAVYVVERLLEDLIKRHCQFHIAFFEGELVFHTMSTTSTDLLRRKCTAMYPTGRTSRTRGSVPIGKIGD